MIAMNVQERRVAERYAYRIKVDTEFEGTHFECESEDLSVGGMKLRFVEGTSPAVGSKVELRFHLPELDGEVKIDGQVRWLDRVDGKTCGIQFSTGLRAREAWAVSRLRGPA